MAELNLWQRILKVMEEVGYLEYDGQVSYGTTKYRYLSEEKITATIREAMIKHGVVMVPVQSMPSQIDIGGNAVTSVVMTYMLVNVDDPDDNWNIQMSGYGRDTQDKGILKAQTAAFKYAQRQAFMIPTGDDPDKESSAELDAKAESKKQVEKGKPKSTGKTKPKKPVLDGKITKMDLEVPQLIADRLLEADLPPKAFVQSVRTDKDGNDYKGVSTVSKLSTDNWKAANRIMNSIGLQWFKTTEGHAHWEVPDQKPMEKAKKQQKETQVEKPKPNDKEDQGTSVTTKNGEVLGFFQEGPEDGVMTFWPSGDVDFKTTTNPFEAFLIGRLLDPMKESRPTFWYKVETDNEDILAIHFKNIETEKQKREITSAVRWCFEKMFDTLS